MSIRVVLSDIEGTTSSIDFVHQVLFPYSAKALPEFVRTQPAAVSKALLAVQTHADFCKAPGADTQEKAIALWLRWIAEDRKETSLKSVQGMIWQQGYQTGAYQAHVYADVPPAFQRWQTQGKLLAIYSSGSIAAQKLFFQYSQAGDLRRFFSDYFDTTSGHKREADSYRAIARALGFIPGQILFLSDIREELDAARRAGLTTTGLSRDPAKPLQCDHRVVTSFAEIAL